jgi:hypothetical protein
MGAFHRLSVNMIGVSAQSLLSRPTNIGHPPGGFRVEKYRVYFVGRDGHFNGLEPIVCADDAAAIEMQNALLTGMASSFGTVRGLSVGLSQWGSQLMTFTKPTQVENTAATTAMKRSPR